MRTRVSSKSAIFAPSSSEMRPKSLWRTGAERARSRARSRSGQGQGKKTENDGLFSFFWLVGGEGDRRSVSSSRSCAHAYSRIQVMTCLCMRASMAAVVWLVVLFCGGFRALCFAQGFAALIFSTLTRESANRKKAPGKTKKIANHNKHNTTQHTHTRWQSARSSFPPFPPFPRFPSPGRARLTPHSPKAKEAQIKTMINQRFVESGEKER